MQFDIRHNIAEVSRWLTDAERKQLPFASVLAMTWTAKDIQAEELATMRRVFDRPTPYTMNALRVEPARKSTMVAKVEFREGFRGTPAKRFLNPNVNGGSRSQKSHEVKLATILKGSSFVRPARGAPLDGYGNMRGGHITRILSQLKIMNDPQQNASGSKRSKAKRAKLAYLIDRKGHVVMERRGKTIKPVLVGIRSPIYRKRFPFYEVADQVMAQRLGPNFIKAFRQAMATSGFKSNSTTLGIVGQYAQWTASPEKAALFGTAL